MTAFAKADFSYHNGWLYYGKDNKFVARFKHRGPVSKAVFVTQLVKNHTIEEYFGKLDAGATPLGILIDGDYNWYEVQKAKFLAKFK